MALLERLQQRIREQGLLSVADYMALCLTDPDDGYYTRRDPLGAAGDFTTAPEISQLFGEMVAVWCLSAWERIGRPSAFTLVEFGPGRGTLMADVLRVTSKYPNFMNAARVTLIEASPILQARQKEALAAHAVTWHTEAPQWASVPLLVIANEFLDALPIRQYEYAQGAWRERMVGLSFDGSLCWRLSAEVAQRADLPGDARDGDIWEVCDSACVVVQSLASHIAGHGGALWLADYGHNGEGYGDTLQAVKAHAYHPVLNDPGNADLTAHVNFAPITAALQQGGLAVEPLMTQREFLVRHGIFERATRLLAGADAAQKKALLTGLERLTSPEAMGTLFKVLVAYGA